MTSKQYDKLKLIADNISLNSKLKPIFSYSDIVGTWDRSVYYNRIQEPNEVTKQIELFDEEDNTLSWFNVSIMYTRLEWFKLLIACECFYTRQELRKLMNN